MSYALLDAQRVKKASELSLRTLRSVEEASETHHRKTAMIERIHALAGAAAETEKSGLITLTSEEFWLISKNW